MWRESELISIGRPRTGKKHFFSFKTQYSGLPKAWSLSVTPGFERPWNWATVRLGRAPVQFILDSWGCGVGGWDRTKWREIEIWVKEIEGDLHGLHRLPLLSTVFLETWVAGGLATFKNFGSLFCLLTPPPRCLKCERSSSAPSTPVNLGIYHSSFVCLFQSSFLAL